MDAFVHTRFGARVPAGNFAWFKNDRSLKSVHAVEHFHVMLFEADERFVESITGGGCADGEEVGGVGVVEGLAAWGEDGAACRPITDGNHA